MRRKPFSRCRGLIGQVLLVLILIVILVILVLLRRPRGNPRIRQWAQLQSMGWALELHANEFGAFAPSDANDVTGTPYCGAMKLCEGAMGQDLLGVHSQSVFRADGLDETGASKLYPDDIRALEKAERDASLKERKGPYLQRENANGFRLADIYGEGNTGPFDGDVRVLCDTYVKKRPSGEKTGMPVLYYRADSDGTTHDVNAPDNPQNIYDYRDNQTLLGLGVPGEPNAVHPLSDPKRFYLMTQHDAAGPPRPKKADTFILISAGYDGLYGTADDICNFQWKYRE